MPVHSMSSEDVETCIATCCDNSYKRASALPAVRLPTPARQAILDVLPGRVRARRALAADALAVQVDQRLSDVARGPALLVGAAAFMLQSSMSKQRSTPALAPVASSTPAACAPELVAQQPFATSASFCTKLCT